jgi:hypothetical protein
LSGNDERIWNEKIDFCPLCKNHVNGWNLRNEQNHLIGILNFNRRDIPLLIMPEVNLPDDLDNVLCYICHMAVHDISFILQIKNKIKEYMKGE